MAVSVVNLGRYRSDASGPDAGFASLSGGNLVASAYGSVASPVWGYRFRWRSGKSGGTAPTQRAALYAKGATVPEDLLGYSGSVSASTTMVASTDGAFYESDVAFSTTGPSNASIPIPSGTIPALALLSTGASATVGLYVSDGTQVDPKYYARTGLSQPPPDPFGTPASQNVEGNITLSIYCHTNEAPVAPVNRSPSGTITSVTPTLEADHRDKNGPFGVTNGDGFDDGDYMTKYKVRVRRVSDGVLMWDPSPFTADAGEIASNHFNVTYAGTTLVRGTAYEWQCWTYDYFNAKGDETTWLAFTPAALGAVTLAGSPSSTIQTNVPTFDYTWSHLTPLSTNAVQIRLYQGDTLVYTSGTITKTTANGATGTLSWADTGLGTPYPNGLNWGTTWKYDIRGRDTANVWSDYSARRQFKTDASPSIPDGLEPSNGQLVTAYPLLTFQLTDADDTVASGLLGKVRIKNNAGTVLFTHDATYNVTTGLWEYQTTGTDLATFATYRWDAYGFDGTLYSGAKTVEANATKSGEETFVYANGPTATITSPTDGGTITSSTPTVTWTGSSQNRYRLTFYTAGTTEVIYQRGWVVSGATSWAVPAGFLHHGDSYDIELLVEDSTPLQGAAPIITIDAAYTPPASVPIIATPTKIGNDPFETAILLTWDATAEPAPTFVEYRIYRSDIGLTGRAYVAITSPDQTSYLDTLPTSGVEYTYAIRVIAQRDLDRVSSARTYASATIHLGGVVLVDVDNPTTNRAVLDSVQERDQNRIRDEQIFLLGTNEQPVTARSPVKYWEIPAVYKIMPPSGTGGNQKAAIDLRVAEMKTLEDTAGVIYYRDEQGEAIFGRIYDYGFKQLKLYPIFTFGIRQESRRLGLADE